MITDSDLSWWHSMPDGAWVLLGVVLTVVSTWIIDSGRRRFERERTRRSELLAACENYLQTLGPYRRFDKFLLSDEQSNALVAAGTLLPYKYLDQYDLDEAACMRQEVHQRLQEIGRLPWWERIFAISPSDGKLRLYIRKSDL